MTDLQQDLAKCVPSNWCDPLLTGPDAALVGHPGTWGGHDIERLLNGIRERIQHHAAIAEAVRDAERWRSGECERLYALLRAARPLADTESPEGLQWMLDVRAVLYAHDRAKTQTCMNCGERLPQGCAGLFEAEEGCLLGRSSLPPNKH